MLITELDGMGRHCPMKLYSFIDEYNEERGSPDRDCETTNCMAWRWYDKPNCDGERRGYCGLAGKPQYKESDED